MNVPGEVYSATWDTRFLELPPGKVLLASFDKIPTRPTAAIDLKFEEQTNSVLLQVTESKQTASSYVARYNGDKLELSGHKYNEQTKQVDSVWYDWNSQPRFQNEEEALCWMVLLFSDVGCPNQARADMPTARTSNLWSKLWREMQHLHPVAFVMLT